MMELTQNQKILMAMLKAKQFDNCDGPGIMVLMMDSGKEQELINWMKMNPSATRQEIESQAVLLTIQ